MFAQWRALLAGYFNKKTSVSFIRPPRFSDDMARLCEELNELALEVARSSFRIRLDYSVKSIAQVEQILDRLHKTYVSTGSDDGLNGLAAMFGAYIVQVIEQNFSAGVWERDDKAFGANSFPYHWEDTTLFPVGWCGKRIFEGKDDDVQMKFKVLVLEHWLKKQNQL